ncbi:hypothetical protein QVD17_31332 [Tagetes erecta]|uniref:Uncharacterized protein n=1 Tax=Tagetes erecta TaxID=13708 RepID=A0AAD8NNF4_TARER|nr:hypothetical protein QVD17_31332 [Tagetes erecta]
MTSESVRGFPSEPFRVDGLLNRSEASKATARSCDRWRRTKRTKKLWSENVGVMSFTKYNATQLSKVEITSSNGKDPNAETPTHQSDDKAFKRQLVEDVDEDTSMFATKKGSGSKEVKPLIPKMEK